LQRFWGVNFLRRKGVTFLRRKGVNFSVFSRRAWDEGVRANWSEFRNLRNAVDNGLKGEDYIAKALYDMWDGPNKGLPEVTNPDLDNILGEEDAHPFNDRNRLNGGDFIIDNTGFW